MEGLLQLFLSMNLSDETYIAQTMNKIFTPNFMCSHYWPADKCHAPAPSFVDPNFVKWLDHFVVSEQSGCTALAKTLIYDIGNLSTKNLPRLFACGDLYVYREES